MKPQISILDEIIVDNFAGGGGASTGIELATGRPVTIAINHDPDAILMHKTNHPFTKHYCESVWEIDPVRVCAGRTVGLAWFSPDCKHFSKAKGSKPVEKKIRGLAWIVLRWAALVRPRIIILENVEEFKTWGPVRRGKPVKIKAGQTFDRWLFQLRALGYNVDYRELIAADYGTPTIRKRFFLVARRDGKPIVWPKATHTKDGTNGTKKWRSAAEIIDWSLPCPSIFDSRQEVKDKYGVSAIRPLAKNTLRRVIRGVDKFVVNSASPFIVLCNHSGDFRGQDIREPLQTVTGKHGYSVVTAALTMHNNTNAAGTDADKPLNTITTRGQQMLITPVMTAIGQTGFGSDRTKAITDPVNTTVSKAESCLVAPSLIQYHAERAVEQVRGQNIDRPIMTVDGSNRYAMAAAFVSKFYGTSTGQSIREPLHTVTISPAHFGAVKVYMVKWNGGQDLHRWPQIRELLNTFCGYTIEDDQVLVLEIGGVAWFISDIGLRMLTPRELYVANGFPSDYIIDRDYEGNEYGKSKQVARCGNAVPPPFAKALVTANLPEWCDTEIETMAELERMCAL